MCSINNKIVWWIITAKAQQWNFLARGLTSKLLIALEKVSSASSENCMWIGMTPWYSASRCFTRSLQQWFPPMSVYSRASLPLSIIWFKEAADWIRSTACSKGLIKRKIMVLSEGESQNNLLIRKCKYRRWGPIVAQKDSHGACLCKYNYWRTKGVRHHGWMRSKHFTKLAWGKLLTV